MRARSLKPSLFKNEVLGAADPLFTILFEGLWCMADREGRLEDRPIRIRAEVFPYRSACNIDEQLDWLEENKFIKRYEVKGLKAIQVLAFSEHQHPHKNEVPSTLPPYTEVSTTKARRASHQGTKSAQPKPVCDPPLDDALGLTPSSLTPDSGLLTADNSTSGQKSASPPFTPQSVPGLDLESWTKWVAYRSAIKKPIKPPSMQAAAEEMAKLGTGQAAAVQNSISNGYQGLFPPKTNGSGEHKRRLTRFEEVTALASPAAHEDQGFG